MSIQNAENQVPALDRDFSELDAVSLRCFTRYLVGAICVLWALFQLALPQFLILDSIQIRAIHLGFALALIFLALPWRRKKSAEKKDSSTALLITNYILAILAAICALYIMLDWEGIINRSGNPTTRDLIVGVFLIIFLLEASRRALGPALGIIAVLFTVYAFLGPHMPGILAFKGVSIGKYLTKITLSDEGIYGIPLDVSANMVFLFVLFGAMLSKVGAGNFFNDLAIAIFGRYTGGPAKAAVVSSGFTGLVSGSSIANVVTTGTFTIPLMKKVGYPAKIAAATEVAASTNGQLMPPIMGAAAFIMAEYLGVSYLQVVKAAIVPAVVSYGALFYITHLEARKLGMSGLSREETPRLKDVLAKGGIFLIPLVFLIFELMVMRRSPKMAAFKAIIVLTVIILIKDFLLGVKNGDIIGNMLRGLKQLLSGLISGSMNMLSVAIATATAGIVVGVVTMGIGGMIVQIVETLAMGNIFLLLIITAFASLVLGMGLPTTATYIVMASITVPVIIKLSGSMGINPIPAIAAHLFCFYFGILADDTPPVGLAAYTAAAIAESDPIQTGIQGFIYDLRTAVIPFMFVFNPELVLWHVNSYGKGILIFVMAMIAACAFTNAVQGWFLTKNRYYEVPFFLLASLLLFWPGCLARFIPFSGSTIKILAYTLGILIYLGLYLFQKIRIRQEI